MWHKFKRMTFTDIFDNKPKIYKKNVNTYIYIVY